MGNGHSIPSSSLETPDRASRKAVSVSSTPNVRRVQKTSCVSLSVTGVDDRRRSQSQSQCRGGGKLSFSDERAAKAIDTFVETGDFGFSLGEHLKLSPFQIQILQQTWNKMKQSSWTLSAQVFNDPIAREIFHRISIAESFSFSSAPSHKPRCDLREHSRLLTELIDRTLQNIDQPYKTIQDECRRIGALHVSSCLDEGMSLVWDSLGEALSTAITRMDGVRGRREALRAWISIITFLMDNAKTGYSSEQRQRKRTITSSTQ